ncbi:MAG: hypothetical protein AB1424_11300 [Thermodesulfobacteriota bacterium]
MQLSGPRMPLIAVCHDLEEEERRFAEETKETMGERAMLDSNQGDSPGILTGQKILNHPFR